MNYTENYHLPQWEESDRIMMDDFNSAMSNLEEGITGAKSSADNAQSTADAAKETAESAFFKIGTYTGRGTTAVTVDVGFTPRLVIVAAQQNTDSGTNGNLWKFGIISEYSRPNGWLTDNGFTVTDRDTRYTYPSVGISNTTYTYIAFR